MKIIQFKEQYKRDPTSDIKPKAANGSYSNTILETTFVNPEEEIYTFMPFTPDTLLEPHILYIGCNQTILSCSSKLPLNFLCLIGMELQEGSSCLPGAANHTAKPAGSSRSPGLLRQNLPQYAAQYPNANFIFLACGKDMPLKHVYDKASHTFLAENRYTSQINRLVAASNSNRGLQHLIDEACIISRSPIIVIDSSYRILAMYRDTVLDAALNLGTQRSLGFLTEYNLKRMKRDKIFEQLRASSKKLRYGKASDSDYYWVDTLVFIHGIEVAEIGVTEYDHPFTDYDFEFIHFLSQLVAWEMQKKSFVSPHLMQMHGIFLSELLDQKFSSLPAIESRKNLLGWKDAPYLYIFTVFSISQPQANIHKKAEIFSIQLSSLLPDCHWTIQDGNLVFLIMKETDGLEEFQTCSPLSERLERNNMYGILSNRFSQLADVKKHYEQTLSVKEYKAYFAPQTPIGFYTDFYIYHIGKILSETHELKDFCHPAIFAIQKYDTENNTKYLETLAEYLTHIDNLSISAQNLCIHKNTFFYRMNKVKELFAVD